MKSIRNIVILFIVFQSVLFAANPFPKATPESQGISSAAILQFLDRAEAELDALHSVMIIRHGQNIAQGWWYPYSADKRHMLFSLSKSFTSTAIGMAIDEGLLSLNDTVISFFAEETPENPSDHLKAMRVRDLLAMNSGHQEDTTNRLGKDPNKTWVQEFLSLDVEHKPGTHFVYNSGATFMLSAILQKVTGQTVLDYLTPRLFEPLGIEDPIWESNPQGINFGGWGLSVKTEDIAKLGQLYLQKGEWNGKQLISKWYVEKATSRQTSNGSNPESDWEQGYGYQFWMCRHGLYRGDGAFGQYCIVMPEQDAVVAITSGVSDMQAVMNLVWDTILPAMKSDPLTENPAVQKKLEDRLANLNLKMPEGQLTSPLMTKISAKTYVFDENDEGLLSVKIDSEKDKLVLTIKNQHGVHAINCGLGSWELGETILNSPTPQRIGTSGAWATADDLKVTLCNYETPFCTLFDVRFINDEMHMTARTNVYPGNPQELVGKMK